MADLVQYYSGTKLLSLLDMDGNRPEIYICESNRSAGKTTFFNKMVVNRYIKTGAKFCFLFRYKYELDGVHSKIFDEIKRLFFPDMIMTSKIRAKGVYSELFLNDTACGYAIAINSAENIKKLSHLLADSTCLIFDEFQTESNVYCSNEINKFISIHTSLARGGGKQVKYLPVYMISNPITLLNPYYSAFKISSRLKSNTKFLRGKGFVMESGYFDSVAKLQSQSAFNQAFSSENYVENYLLQATYLNDNKAFISKMNGYSQYLCTVKYKGTEFAIRKFTEQGIVYCDMRPDTTFPTKISATTYDHNINYIMINPFNGLLNILRYYFEHGSFRFSDLKCKNMVLDLLSIK